MEGEVELDKIVDVGAALDETPEDKRSRKERRLWKKREKTEKEVRMGEVRSARSEYSSPSRLVASLVAFSWLTPHCLFVAADGEEKGL